MSPPDKVATTGGIAVDPESCFDGVSGRWVGAQSQPQGHLQFKLELNRAVPFSDHLLGSIGVHYWEGHSGSPPPCNGGEHVEYTVTQLAEGKMEGSAIEFTGVKLTRKVDLCGKLTRYHTDSFSGRFVADKLLLVNDDGFTGSREVEFIRTRCGGLPAFYNYPPFKWFIRD